MRYISQDEKGTWLLDSYLDYVAELSKTLPADLKELVRIDRLDPKAPNSMHDSWVSKVLLSDDLNHNSESNRGWVELHLLGPYQDRIFLLRYDHVLYYELKLQGKKGFRAYSDLLVQELVINEDGCYQHEIIFSREDRFLVQCKGIQFKEEMLRKNPDQ